MCLLTTVGPLESRFRGQRAKCLTGNKTENEALESAFPKLQSCLESIEQLSRNHHSNMTPQMNTFMRIVANRK